MGRPRFVRSVVLLLGILLLVVGLHISGALTFIEMPLTKVFYRGTEVLYTLNVWDGESYVTKRMSLDELRSSFLQLQATYRNAVVDHATLLELQDENTNLKKQIKFFSEKQWIYYTGHVTGKQIDPFESTVLLYIEQAYIHIPVGSPVITQDGIFVGTVVAVEGNVVNIRLLDDGNTKVGAALLNQEKTVGIAEGGFGKSIRMNFIPQNEKVVAGDIVVTSGLTQEIPYGLPIGVVEAIEKEPYEPFQSAVLSPLASSNSLQILSIIVANINA